MTKQCQKCKRHQTAYLWGEDRLEKSVPMAELEFYEKLGTSENRDALVQCKACGHEFTAYQYHHIPTKRWLR